MTRRQTGLRAEEKPRTDTNKTEFESSSHQNAKTRVNDQPESFDRLPEFVSIRG
jgi:hypothetical protein